MTDYTVGVLEDAIQILDILQQTPDGETLANITDSSGLVKNKVFRLLYTLEKHQLVQKDADGKYSLAVRMLSYAQAVKQENRLLNASSEAMDWLMDMTGETIFLGVRSGTDALCVAARESTQSIRLYAEVGRRAPLHSGGVPKALFAHLPRDNREQLLDSFHANDDTLDIAQLRHQLDVIRKDGYVVVVDELDVGAHSVAAPIFGHDGAVVAALSVAGPSHRFAPQEIERYIQYIREATAQISEKLGYRAAIPT
ncbi:MAG: IclR family transcriptional regulator [Chloroflexota bacterium]